LEKYVGVGQITRGPMQADLRAKHSANYYFQLFRSSWLIDFSEENYE